VGEKAIFQDSLGRAPWRKQKKTLSKPKENSRKKRYSKTLWGGPLGENKKTLRKQKKQKKNSRKTKKTKKQKKNKQYSKTLWGGPLGEKQKNPEKTKQKTSRKQKKNNIPRLFGDGPDPQDF